MNRNVMRLMFMLSQFITQSIHANEMLGKWDNVVLLWPIIPIHAILTLEIFNPQTGWWSLLGATSEFA